MKKILFLILGSTVACSSVNAMKNPLNNKFALLEEASVTDQKPLTHDINDSKKEPTKLISTPHAKEQMKKSGIIQPQIKKVSTKLIFTDHAQERMEERGITQSQIEDAIKFGQKSSDAKYNDCFIYTNQINETFVTPKKNISNQEKIYAIKVVTRTTKCNQILIITVFIKRMFDTEKKSQEEKAREAVIKYLKELRAEIADARITKSEERMIKATRMKAKRRKAREVREIFMEEIQDYIL
jgi:hypothetical protein